MLLKEIVGVDPLPYEWLTNTIGQFTFNNRLFGIVIEVVPVDLITRKIQVANIAFGLVHDTSQSISAANIDRSPTGFGNPLTVYSTVASACINNISLRSYDVLMLGATDAVRDKRANHYLRAVTETAWAIPEFKDTIRLKAQNGNIAVVLSKTEFTDEEKQTIVQLTGLGKI